VPPVGNQNDPCAGANYEALKNAQQLFVDDVGQFSRIGSFLGIENAVDIEKDHPLLLHARSFSEIRQTRLKRDGSVGLFAL
jgi:hypothetical protein